jgi:hypothetical protein
MYRLFVTLIIIALLAACQPPKEQAVLSGVLWGGEGNRMLISPATESIGAVDTILIDHHGEFVWNPDTVIPGFYFLEKNDGNRLVVVFSVNQPVHVDAQYINFPTNAKVSGSDYSIDLFQVENISKNWQQALQKASAATSDSGWIPSPLAVKNIQEQLDSITEIYRADVLKMAEKPLVRMYALLQTAGHRQLFDPWKHRQLFYATDSLLLPYLFLSEVRQFSKKVAQLKATELLALKYQPGDSFPDIVLARNQVDTLSSEDFEQSTVYISLSNPAQQNEQSMYHESLQHLNRYQWSGLKAVFLLTDSASITKDNPRFYYYNYGSGLSYNLKEELGIVNLPANFLLNEEGIIVAKNVWGNKLKQVLEQLHQK